MIRCFSFTDYGAFESNRAYANLEIRKGYDKNVNEYEVLEKLGTNLYIAYQSTNRIVTVGPRDFYHYI